MGVIFLRFLGVTLTVFSKYTNMALVDQLQKIDGVRIPELRSATTVAAGESVVTAIDARCVPAAGYFEMGDIKLNMKVYNG